MNMHVVLWTEDHNFHAVLWTKDHNFLTLEFMDEVVDDSSPGHSNFSLNGTR